MLTAQVAVQKEKDEFGEMCAERIAQMLDLARQYGVIVQVDIVSDMPPRMGAYRQEVSYRMVRG